MRNPRSPHAPSRRNFLRHGAGLLAGGLLSMPGSRLLAAPAKRLKVAAVFTELTFRSHAHVLLENFLEPYYFDAQPTDSGCDIVAFYGDQFPLHRDVSRAVAKAFGIPIY